MLALVLAFVFLAPEGTTTRDEAAIAGSTTLASGPYEGADSFHFGAGTVSLVRDTAGAHHLRFEGYAARSGPDVYFYLVRDAGAATTEAVEGAGLKVRVPGGAEDGQATVRGDFNVALPADFDPQAWTALVAWCDQYNARFGTAVLAPPGG